MVSTLAGPLLPASEPEPLRYSLMNMVRRNYIANPDRRMLVGVRSSVTYADAYHGIGTLAWYMNVTCGIGVDSIVAISSTNDLEVPLIMAAVQMRGAMLLMLPATPSEADLERIFAMAKPSLVIMSSAEDCAMAARAVPGARIMSLHCRVEGVSEVTEILDSFSYNSAKEQPDYSDQARIVVFSSGSTGLPKAIVNRMSSFGRNGEALKAAFSMTSRDVLFVPVPLSHVFGIVGVFCTLASDASLVTCEKYTPEAALSLIANTQATIHFGVSTMFVRELRVNRAQRWDLSCLRAALVAGAPCPASVIVEFEERYGCTIMQSYGMSETSATLTVTSLDLPLEERASCVGVPVAGAAVKILPDTGEILCKSPSMMLGVLQPDGSLKLDLDDEGWLHTGDVGYVDDAGQLVVSGRIKDMIIRGGINIFPAEVERVYQENAEVSESCMVGYPDPELGERTCLCVIMAPDAQSSSRDLRDFSKGLVEKCKIPDVVLKMDSFPRLASGKIDKKQLKSHVKQMFADFGGARRNSQGGIS